MPVRFPWPARARMAMCLTWDVDGESAHYVRDPERARGQLSELHQRAYGPQCGVPRILRMLERHAVPATFYIPAYTAGVHQQMVASIVAAGHPIGLHGYLHESLDTLDATQEEQILVRSKAILTRLTGSTPTLYRAPSCELNRRTPALLVRHGVTSDASLSDDDLPYALETVAGPLIEIPFQWLLDDYPFWGYSRLNRDKTFTDPDSVFGMWRDEFDGAYEEGGCFVITLHPFISGRATCMSAIERVIRHAKTFDDVWWATVDDVARHAETLLAEGRLPVRSSPPPEPEDLSALE